MLGIAVISDRITPHFEGGRISYFVGSSNVAGRPGMPGIFHLQGESSGSLDVYADGRSVHRKNDVAGIPHFTNAMPSDQPLTGLQPANILPGLGAVLVWRLHHQPFLIDGSADVYTNGQPSGYHGARYICSAVIEGRLEGIPTVFVSPRWGGIPSLSTVVEGVGSIAFDEPQAWIETKLERQNND